MSDKVINIMKCEFIAKSINEGLARSVVSSFASVCDPSVAVIADLKTAISEAVTNAIVHGYSDIDDKSNCPIYIQLKLFEGGRLVIKIKDKGKGIDDVKAAMQPLYTTDTDGERSGMGFTIMESFTDGIKVKSKLGKGTTVMLEKRLY